MKSIFRYLLLYGFVISLAACSKTPPKPPTETQVVVAARLEVSNTPKPTQIAVNIKTTITDQPSTPTQTLTLTSTSEPYTDTPEPACVWLNYGEYAQFEINVMNGQRILVDIFDPKKLSSPVDDADILLTTHTHWDHYNQDFQTAFTGSQLFVQAGKLEVPGVVIHGIESAHNVGDRFKAEGGTNYIYLIETGALRIAHFGDIGQKTLTDEQLSTLSDIDIVITQINNPYSDMNAENMKGINLIEQVQPRIVIPTHLNLDTVKIAAAKWNGYISESSNLMICESDLKQDGIQFLLVGESAQTIAKYVEFIAWENR
jgi:hypothetical protein